MRLLYLAFLIIAVILGPSAASAQTDVVFMQEDFDGVAAPNLPDGECAFFIREEGLEDIDVS